MPLIPNEQIGPYVIERELGRGGMCVVYLGRDTRLDRAVAIKSLPEHLAQDPDRLARFEREAKALAQLNHPNVAGIYGVEVFEGHRYLILEFVEGETLADRLDRGPLPVDEALDLAAQIAAGVEEAHEVGVVHRDLKPGNVIVTPEGRAKVLDFGLARMSDAASSSSVQTQSPTLTTPAIHSPTMPGVIMGTAAYMSPEQARGRSVDKRTDIWSFGVMLYEMLAGANPFVGETVSDSIGAVLHKRIDLDRLPPTTPPGVRRVLTRCVERDKSLRYRDIGDVRVELLRAEDDPGGSSEPKGSSGGWGALRWAGTIALVAAMCAAMWFGARATAPHAPIGTRKLDVVVSTDEIKLRNAEPKISPDGTIVGYIHDGRVFIRDLDAFASRELPGTEDALDLFWSPDGKWIGYHTRRAVFKAPLTGGAAIKLTSEVLDLGGVTGGGWTADDHIVFAEDKGISRVSARGGAATVVLPVDKKVLVDYHDVTIVPGTNTVLYIEHRRDMSMVVMAMAGDRRAEVAAMDESYLSHPAYAPSGHVLFTRNGSDRSVWAVAFDPDRLEVSGDPFLVEAGCWQPSVSRDGTLAVLRGDDAHEGALAWVNRAGDVEPIADDFEEAFGPMLSPDGSKLAFSAGEANKMDVWVRDLERGVNSRVTFVEGMVGAMGWSPDGREIAVGHYLPSDGVPARTLFRAADGSGETRKPLDAMLMSCDAGWNVAVIAEDPTSQKAEISAARFDDLGDRTHVIEGTNGLRSACISPDGALLLYDSDESGQTQVFCTRYPSGTGKWQVSTQGGSSARWSADGSKIYFVSSERDKLFEIEVTREPSLRFTVPSLVLDAEALGLALGAGWWPSADGQRFVVLKASEEAASDRRAISVIENWFEAFRAR